MLRSVRRSAIPVILVVALLATVAWAVAASAAPTTEWAWGWVGPPDGVDINGDPIIVKADVRAMSAADSTHVWGVGWYSDDTLGTYRPLVVSGPSAWTATKLSTYTGRLNGVDAFDATHVWAVGDSGLILKWDGSSWIRQGAGVTNEVLNAVSFSDASNGWAVGNAGTILRTMDGGATWTLSSSGTTEILHGISAPAAGSAFAVGANGVTRRWDGSAWLSVPTVGTNLRSVSFPDATHGWAVGEFGTFLRWDSGTSSWVSQSVPALALWPVSDMHPQSVVFTDAYHGIVVGKFSFYWRTSDGGATWETAREESALTESGNLDLSGVAVAPDDPSMAWASAQTSGLKGDILSATLAVIPPPTYTLTYSAGTGGTLSGVTSQTVNYNRSGTAVTANASIGYHFTGWSDGVSTATRTDTNVTANVNVTANFAIDAPGPVLRSVWRFYNLKKGVYFYTASEAEMARVRDTLSATYHLEGVGYYLAP